MTTMDGAEGSQRGDTRVTDRFAAKAHETVDDVAAHAEQAERDVRDAAARTAEQARELREEVTERAEEGMRRANAYLQRNPLAFVGIAFAAGVLACTMLRR